MYLRLSPYREVLQGIYTDLQVNEGIIKITGKSGAGKTALCSQLFHELEHNGQPAVFFLKHPASATALQNNILDNLHLDPAGNFTRTLTAYLIARTAGHKPLVLIFDDAQNLDAQTFSAIRMLCNIQNESRALVRVILCGTEELDAKLASPTLRSVTQFLSQSATLPYLTQEQVHDFCHEYWLAMTEDMKPLSEKALQRLFQETRGHPGILHARLNQGTTGAEKNEHYTGDEQTPAEQRPFRYAGQRPGWVPGLMIIVGLLLFGGAGLYLYLIPSIASDTVVVVDNVSPATPVPAPVAAPPVVVAEPETTAPVEVAAEETAPDANADAQIVDTTDDVAVTTEQEDAVEEATTPDNVDVAGDSETQTPAESDVQAPVEAATLPPVEDFITAWAAAWQARDVDTYLAQYHPEFTPAQGATQDAWREQRRRVISNAGEITLNVEPPESVVEGADDTRVVRFWLGYRTPTYADRTLKELLLAPVDGSWRIRAENNLRTERE